MRVKIFSTRAVAEAARDFVDRRAGLPRVHGSDEYTIAEPGNAAATILARGVHTEHAVDIIASADGTQFAVPSDDDDAVEIDPEAWRGAGHNPRDTRVAVEE